MKLKSEIIAAAYEYTAVDATNTNGFGDFINGAEWMQKTIIEKAYQWILNNMHKYIKTKGFEIYVNNEDMANGFKQAMEE